MIRIPYRITPSPPQKNKMVLTSYKELVLKCLRFNRYPVLQHFVFLDIYYKMIPEREGSSPSVWVEPGRSPDWIYENENGPFRYIYLTGEGRSYCIHTLETFRTRSYPLRCISIKLYKNSVNESFRTTCETFEEEIYHFITYLNTDVTKIRHFLNLSFSDSTRFVPQRIVMWISERVSTQPAMKACGDFESYFGPSKSHFETRLVRGKLSPCTSKETLLSLNDDVAWKPEMFLPYHPYNYHYSTAWNAFVPLAFNPLENSIVY